MDLSFSSELCKQAVILGTSPRWDTALELQTPQCECHNVGVCMWTGCLGSEKSRAWVMPTQWFLSGKHLEVDNHAPSECRQQSWRARHLHLLSWLTPRALLSTLARPPSIIQEQGHPVHTELPHLHRVCRTLSCLHKADWKLSLLGMLSGILAHLQNTETTSA